LLLHLHATCTASVEYPGSGRFFGPSLSTAATAHGTYAKKR